MSELLDFLKSEISISSFIFSTLSLWAIFLWSRFRKEADNFEDIVKKDIWYFMLILLIKPTGKILEFYFGETIFQILAVPVLLYFGYILYRDRKSVKKNLAEKKVFWIIVGAFLFSLLVIILFFKANKTI